MGNTTATGHVMQHTGLASAVGFQQTLQLTMWQNNIQPWSAADRMKNVLMRQTELAKKSPFRYIGAREGMAYFGQHCGGWVIQLNREKFVRLSLDLFASRGMTVPPEEAKLFYDVFDSIDLYNNGTLSIGELAGGLSTFFGGSPEDRATAVYDVVRMKGQLDKSSFQEFLKPYIWVMVPPNATLLRPILLPHVADRMFEEITGGDPRAYCITPEQLKFWMFRGSALSYGYGASNPMVMSEVTSNAVAERAAAHVDMAINAAYAEYSARMGLREYGQQTWAKNHPGQPQNVTDIGVARYIGDRASGAQQTLVSSAVSRTRDNIAPTIAPLSQYAPLTLGPQILNNIGQQANVMVTSAADMLNDFVYSRDRSGSTYSTSTIGTSKSIVGTTGISGTTTIAPQSPRIAPCPPPAAPNAFPAPSPSQPSFVQPSAPPSYSRAVAPQAAVALRPPAYGAAAMTQYGR